MRDGIEKKTDEIGEASAMKVLMEAREMLRELTPLKTNCGKLCDGACCQGDESGDNGMALFPFEERLYEKPMEDFPFRLLAENSLIPGGKRLVCEGHCPRDMRPLQCRLFPLRIRLEKALEGPGISARAEIDPRAFAVCPLLEMGGLRAMDGRFVEAVQRAGKMLAENRHMREALEREQRMMEELCRL